MYNTYAVVLSGGSGERLWPLSRKNKPKQLIPFQGKTSMLEQALDRLLLVVKNKEQLGLVTTAQYEPVIFEQMGTKYGFVIAEPAPRNTAAATVLTCLNLIKQDPNAVIVFCPADHFIKDDVAFADRVTAAVNLVQQQDLIAVLGVVPTYPATGYGYILSDVEAESLPSWSPVQLFTEKPSLAQAKIYLEQGNVFWNIGVYIGKASVILKEIEHCSPELYQAVVDYVEFGTDYRQIPSISIDYALAEKSKKMIVFPSDFAWSDVGNLTSFLSYAVMDTQKKSLIINTRAENNAAYAHKKAVAFVGVNDLCVVETDDVILVVNKNDAEAVRSLVQDMRSRNLDMLL